MLLIGEWNKEFVGEHGFFPFGRLKDQVDAASGAFNKVAAKKLVRNLLPLRNI
jgi:phage terminase large subunit-like protein